MIGLFIVTRRVPIVEQELFTLPEYLSLPSAVCGLRVAPFLIFCVILLLFVVDFFVNFYIAIVLFVVLKFKASDYPSVIFNLFYRNYHSLSFKNIKYKKRVTMSWYKHKYFLYMLYIICMSFSKNQF